MMYDQQTNHPWVQRKEDNSLWPYNITSDATNCSYSERKYVNLTSGSFLPPLLLLTKTGLPSSHLPESSPTIV